MKVFAHIIRGPGHKHGKRNRQDGERFVSLFEFVQEAITKEYPQELPPLTNVPQLTKKVRKTDFPRHRAARATSAAKIVALRQPQAARSDNTIS